VLLEIERGSVRGIFGALVGGDDRERLVTTPSAVLAVRGTDYGVEVEKDGDTSVAVFEGIVEVRDTAGVGEAVRVSAGQSVRIRRGRAAGRPAAHGLSSGDWDRGRRVRTQAPGGPGGSQGMGRPGQPGGGPPASSPQGGSKRPGG
jgi:ferric-dicitrate binding protein FerR (iron transport regulator)